MARIALVTYRPDEGETSADRDLPVLVEALRAAGADAASRYWDDPDADWGSYDLVVIRSTWDYSWRAAEFVAWAERCGQLTRLANPAAVVRWNTDKRYLGELAGAGVPVVPTRYLAPGDPLGLPDDHEYVVKPTSGAGARLAARYTPGERETAVRQLARMHEQGLTAMVQPYLTHIDTTGERALQFFGGRFLHASRKGPYSPPARPTTPTRSPTPAAALAADPGRTRRRRKRVGRRTGRPRTALRARGPRRRRKGPSGRHGAGTRRTEPLPVAAPKLAARGRGRGHRGCPVTDTR
uniref:ATP-grasp domain-containing protein n=1 Tax=Streptomyces avermitilis TaxID=33903 RepID=A0A499VHJ0_STRAX|nr:hypothetical protein SAVMC3_65420 [Streptomyces avermitilis]